MSITQACECGVCARSRALIALVDSARISKAEAGALLDLVADWWGLAHQPERKTEQPQMDTNGHEAGRTT